MIFVVLSLTGFWIAVAAALPDSNTTALAFAGAAFILSVTICIMEARTHGHVS